MCATQSMRQYGLDLELDGGINESLAALSAGLFSRHCPRSVTGACEVGWLRSRGPNPLLLRLPDRRQDPSFAGGCEAEARRVAVQITIGSLGNLPRAKVPPLTTGDARLGIWDRPDVSFRRRRSRCAPAALRSFPPCRSGSFLSGVVFHFASYPSRILLRALNRIRRN